MEVDLSSVRGWILDAKRERLIAQKLGKAIAKARLNAGLNQEQVAEKIGLGSEQVSRIERGIALPTIIRLYEFAELFGCPVDTFLRRSSDLISDKQVDFQGLIASVKDDSDRDFLLNITEQISNHIRSKR